MQDQGSADKPTGDTPRDEAQDVASPKRSSRSIQTEPAKASQVDQGSDSEEDEVMKAGGPGVSYEPRERSPQEADPTADMPSE